MELAAILALGLEDWIDFGVIIAILMLNAFVGFYQEKSAEDIVSKLKGDIAMKTMVVRDGQEQTILARELVPGDIVIIQDGQTVPGDCQLICDYANPDDFEQFKKIREDERLSDDKPGAEGEKNKEEDDGDDNQSVHYGLSLIACGKSDTPFPFSQWMPIAIP